MLQVEIDGKKVSVEYGSTIMEAADKAGVYIPHFCYHKKLSVAANCRMCLVQVDKNAKPAPACATPCTDEMKVFTRSETALKAQKGVMEFLLVNHPLDCPICDQGGECQLQDLSVGYGGMQSRYEEEKRVVINKNLGSLVSTDMTRCIHCTRCVRFGQEVAGIMEMGMVGRGEFAQIMPYIESTIDSELSGNIIDLCPVGALTSKPFRYTARSWELNRRKSVSPHCGLGSNISVHAKNNKVLRVVPQTNEDINECWISDKDRFAYEGLNGDDRLTKPLMKKDGEWIEVDWQEALNYVGGELKRISNDQLGFIGTAHQTLEELYLLQKIARALGCENVDFRLRQRDFALDGLRNGVPFLGQSVESIEEADRFLVIGSDLRKDHPLLAHRIRKAVKYASELNVINVYSQDFLVKAKQVVVNPADLLNTVGQIAKAILTAKKASTRNTSIEAYLAKVTVSADAQAVADSLLSGLDSRILLGNVAEHHPDFTAIYALTQEIATALNAKFGLLGESANSVGGYVAKAYPTSSKGLNAYEMFAKNLKGYVVLGAEAELDSANGAKALSALKQAEFVVALSSYKHQATEYANVILPISPFTETSGTFINTEGKVQSFQGVVKPLGETRPAWKVLRVLANLLNLAGFDYNSSEEIKAEIVGSGDISGKLDNSIKTSEAINLNSALDSGKGLIRVGDIKIYHADALVRRSKSLQKTKDGKAPVASMNSATLAQCKAQAGQQIQLKQESQAVSLTVACDDSLPNGVVRVSGGHETTSLLGDLFGTISVA